MLWEYLKELKTHAPIYYGKMDEDLSNIPENYVVIEESAFDEPMLYGDGKIFMRKSVFNIRIYTVKQSKIKSLTNLYRNKLNEKPLSFKQFGPTYDSMTDMYSVLLTGSFAYAN